MFNIRYRKRRRQGCFYNGRMQDETTALEACDLGWSIGMLARDYSTVVDPVFADVPRGARGYQLLHTVIHKQIRSQIGLADYLGIDRTVMPYVIDDLVTAGFVERAPDPRDRRIRTVVATRAGLAEYEKLSTQVLSAEQRFFAALDDADRATFVRVLSQLAHRD